MRTYRRGDRVTVQAVVRYDHDADKEGHVFVEIGFSPIMVDADKIEIVAPRLDPGDNVSDGIRTATVIAVHGDQVWINYGGDHGRIVAATDLMFIPYAAPEPQQAPYEPPSVAEAFVPETPHDPDFDEIDDVIEINAEDAGIADELDDPHPELHRARRDSED